MIERDPYNHYPYRPAFQEEDICPTCSRYPDFVAWPCPTARLRLLDARCGLAEESTNAHDIPVLSVSEIRDIIGDTGALR